jgi:hypothetical protein
MKGKYRKKKKFAMPVFMTKIFNKATVKVKKILRNDINEQNFSMLASLTKRVERERERERERVKGGMGRHHCPLTLFHCTRSTENGRKYSAIQGPKEEME